MKNGWYLAASALALAVCGAAQAQTAQPASSHDESATVQEVVVTAERRTVDLQKAPLSATVLTGEALQNKGVSVVDQLQFIAPNVTIDNFGQGIDFDIRGIGKGEHNTQTTPGVITYRDGLPTFPGYFGEEPYFDVAGVEVLRGPQGTFAGQNAIGGAVFVTTDNPVIGGGYDGYVQGQVGNYADVGAQGAVNLPINDTLAARVAFDGEARDSFYSLHTASGAPTPGAGDLRWGAGRFSLLWKPSDRLSLLFKTDVDYLDNGAIPGDPYTDRYADIPGTTTPNPFYRPSLFDIQSNAPQRARDEFVRSILKVDYQFDDGIVLRSISGYQLGNTAYKTDLYGAINPAGPITALNPYPGLISSDAWTFADNLNEEIYSEEINLISPDKGFFTWIVGGFAQSDTYDYLAPAFDNLVIGVPPGSPLTEIAFSGHNPQRDLSVFGQVSFNLPAGFQVQLGGRYADTSTKNEFQYYQFGVLLPDTQAASARNFSYKAALNWKVDNDNFLYAFVATGFKPGGLNFPVGLGLPAPFLPETVTDYEAGWKSSFLGGHVHTQVDGFYDDFNRFQVTIGYPAFPTFGFEVSDPSATRLYGFEASAQAVFGDLAFDANLGLTHSGLGAFYATDPRIVSVLPCDPQVGPASASCIDLKGHAQTYSPSLTFNFGVQYNFHLGGGDVLTPRVDYGHISPQWATLFENPALGDQLAARDIVNAQLAWSHGRYVVTLYATNLTNDQYVGALNSNLDFAGPPRQYGVRILKAF
jgi:iron complex outermembrane receptor protein